MMAAQLKPDIVAQTRMQVLPSSRTQKTSDCVTILATIPGKFATKRFVKTNDSVVKHDYDAGFLFGVLQPWAVHNIFELSALQSALEGLPNLLVVRGAPSDPTSVGTRVRRTGSHGIGNFQTPTEGRYWVLLDFDKIDIPAHLSLDIDPVAVCEYLVSLLPPEFHDACYHWTLSSSAGMGDPSRVSMHIWFWLAQPVPDATLKFWAKAVNLAAGFKLVDDALFQHVQAHYTAAPIFEGVTNPFPTRSGLVEKAQHAVDLVIVPATTVASKPRTAGIKPPSTQRNAGAGFEHYLSLIGDHPGGNGFHNAIIAALASYVGTNGKEGTDVEALYELMRDAILAADASRHDAAYIEHMASREHIIPAIEGAIMKFGSQPRRKTKVHAGIQPHFKSQPVSVAEAQRLLAEIAALGL